MKNAYLNGTVRLSLIFLFAVQFLWGCQSRQKIPNPPFSLDSLSTLYAQAKLKETASMPDSLKQESLTLLFKTHSITNDSLRKILNYFQKSPEAWVLFYQKVKTLTDRKKNPAD